MPKKNLKKAVLNHKKIIIVLSSLFILIILFTLIAIGSCNKNKSIEETTQTSETTSLETTKQTESTTENSSYTYDLNPLSGLALTDNSIIGQRPIAIMINNVKVANPQIGVGQAEILFEMEVEYGLTRMMAVFADVNSIPETGSIRSARHDFIDLAGGLDAIFVHIGGSYMAYNQLQNQGTDHLDGQVLADTFWRDQDWAKNRGYEHSVKTTGDRILAAIEKLEIRRDVKEDYEKPFNFNPETEFVVSGDIKADQADIVFSGAASTSLLYNKDSKLYEKSQHGQVQIDMGTNKAHSYTNALILQANIGRVGSDILAEVDLSAGSGYYLTGGKAEEITWEKGGTYDDFKFYKADGSELLLNCGQTYIAIMSDRQTVSFE